MGSEIYVGLAKVAERSSPPLPPIPPAPTHVFAAIVLYRYGGLFAAVSFSARYLGDGIPRMQPGGNLPS